VADISPPRAPDRAGLYELATEQMGHFTVEQAVAFGLSPALLSYHAKRGNLRRVHHGVYRFRDYPPTPREEVAAAWLALGKNAAVVSHDSALDLWDLSDAIPGAVHLTVPRARRWQPRRAPPGVVVHTTQRPWQEGDVRTREGLRVTSPARTLLDVAEAGTGPEQIEMAVAQALRRGWLDADHLRADAGERSQRVADVVERALRRAARPSSDAAPAPTP
jgi:predicted transcriptional regulator of viral defense system